MLTLILNMLICIILNYELVSTSNKKFTFLLNTQSLFEENYFLVDFLLWSYFFIGYFTTSSIINQSSNNGTSSGEVNWTNTTQYELINMHDHIVDYNRVKQTILF